MCSADSRSGRLIRKLCEWRDRGEKERRARFFEFQSCVSFRSFDTLPQEQNVALHKPIQCSNYLLKRLNVLCTFTISLVCVYLYHAIHQPYSSPSSPSIRQGKSPFSRRTKPLRSRPPPFIPSSSSIFSSASSSSSSSSSTASAAPAAPAASSNAPIPSNADSAAATTSASASSSSSSSSSPSASASADALGAGVAAAATGVSGTTAPGAVVVEGCAAAAAVVADAEEAAAEAVARCCLPRRVMLASWRLRRSTTSRDSASMREICVCWGGVMG